MVGNDEAMINTLPDDLLRHIVTFLPTKDAVRTSVLSSRWKYLWTSISNIDLDAFLHEKPPEHPECRKCFLDFVDHLLQLHDYSDLKRFHVSCDVRLDAARVNSWISDVMKRNLKELDLSFPLAETCSLPFCLFTSQCLTLLSLNLGSQFFLQSAEDDMPCVLGFPSSFSVNFPSLKSLKLSKVRFLNKHSMDQLFSNCPLLQELALIHCEWKNIRCMIINIPTLKAVTVHIRHWDFLDCKLRVIAPSLTSFSSKTDSTIDISLEEASSLTNAFLDFFFLDNVPPYGYQRLMILFGEMHNSKFFTVTHLALGAAADLFDQLPVFENLEHLVICSCYLESISEITGFLAKAPNLIFLSVSVDDDGHAYYDRWDDVPVCPMKKLKRFTISGFDAGGNQMDLIRFVKENACILERVEIYASSWWTIEKHVVEEIEEYPRRLENCIIVAYPNSS